MGYTIDIDTGGTFTDGFFAHQRAGGRAIKVRTTPHDLTLCFLQLIEAGAAAYGIATDALLYDTEIIRFSSTIGTNTIIQRDGTKIGLLLGQGMAALAPTGDADGKMPLVEPRMVRQIDAADAARCLTSAQELIDLGARVLVVALANSHRDPAPERSVREIIKNEYPRDFLGSIPVFLASDISFRAGEAARINGAVISAYTHAKLARLLYKAAEELRQRHYRRTLFIAHNNGAVARVAKTRAVATYNSGPTAGLFGARMIGRLYGADDLISVDMGGTSFDIGTVSAGREGHSLDPDIEGFRCNLPMSAIRALGVGGGSLARIADGRVVVGPQSAGAVPGPACFGLGGSGATVTDANLVLGILDAGYFLGGAMALSMAEAVAAIREQVAEPLGIGVEAAALAIRRAADAQMAEGVAEARRSFGGRPPLMIAYGGGGAAHACQIASLAGLDRVVVPRFAAVSSAFSLSLMDAGHLYHRALHLPLDQCLEAPALAEAVAAMRREAERDMRGEGFAPERCQLALRLFLAAGRDETVVEAPVDFFADRAGLAAVEAAARAALAPKAGTAIAVTAVGLLIQAAVPHFAFQETAAAEGSPEAARRGSRAVVVEAGKPSQETPVYDRARLGSGHRLAGPAIVESDQTTLLLPTGWSCLIDGYGNMVLEGRCRHEG